MPAALTSVVKFTIQVRLIVFEMLLAGINSDDRLRSRAFVKRLQAKDIASMDWMSKSDPMCVLYEEDGEGQWVERSRTEGIKASSPDVSPDYFRCFFTLLQSLSSLGMCQPLGRT